VALRELSDATFNFPTRADAYEYAYDALRRLEAKPTHSQERGRADESTLGGAPGGTPEPASRT
jgi:hypothetical protein